MTLTNFYLSDPITEPKPETWEDNLRFLDIKLINVGDFSELMFRFIVNTALILFIVHYIYAKNSNRKDFYFSFISVSVVIFFLCYLLNSVKLELGFALGLFAIFGIIRYRTDAIPIKEMTYLFIVIGVSVINALTNKKVSYVELFFTNTAIAFGLWLLESRLRLKQEDTVTMVYEKIGNIHTLEKAELIKDLNERTGLKVNKYEIQKIDFLRDVAEITLYYYSNGTKKAKGDFKGVEVLN